MRVKVSAVPHSESYGFPYNVFELGPPLGLGLNDRQHIIMSRAEDIGLTVKLSE